jgi:putative Flp pilus-assembly TadE/G-like protein
MRSAHSPPRLRRGAVTVWLLVSVLVLVGIVALGMDGGRMLEKRRHAQATADAAALAAVEQLYANNFALLNLRGKRKGWIRKQQTPTDAALEVAKANGFTNDGTSSIVTVNIPPASGAFAGQSDHAEVIVQYNLPNTFGAIFTKNKAPVRARAVALGRPMPLGVVLLRQSGTDAFLNNSLVAFTLVGSRMYVNSTDPSAFHQKKAGVVAADAYDIAGGVDNSGGALILGRMRTGTRQVGDPLRYVPVPDPSTLNIRSFKSKGKGIAVLQPGIYQDGLKLDGVNKVVMLPGIYIMEGGGFEVSGKTDLAALEVLIYNTSGNTPAGPINIDSVGTIVLTAPTSGDYQGISIFQDRAVTEPLTLTGNSASAIGGTIYAAAAPVELTGAAAAGVTLGGAYVCSTLKVDGIGAINIDLAGNPPQVPEITLVE